ncbi:MAG: SufS family cysteine desulfurase [Lachnospiraceae bacterium]|nr:SufS family cysteine desulfurase [Lachnospiraceae bacterium]
MCARSLESIRGDFPLIASHPLAYLDNAATTQKPAAVLKAMEEYYEKSNANPFRGVYELSEEATTAYEHARSVVADFIHAKRSEEIVFTRNASESLNLVAYSYGRKMLKPGDEIVVSVMEHHSNFLPWKMVAEETGATLVALNPNPDGEITKESLSVIGPKTKLVAITQVSNVFGRPNDIAAITSLAHQYGAVVVVDGAQSVPHMPVDVQALDADFLAFSGHKMFAPMGIGVLYGRMELLEAMPPFMRGGEMIEIVHWDRVTYAPVPHKFEAGTVNAGGAVALAAAMEYMKSIGWDTIMKQEEALTRRAVEGLLAIPHVRLVGSEDPSMHQGIVTFLVEGVHPHDIASILDSKQIAVRAGHHCAWPLMDYLGIHSTCRASFAVYNTMEEVDRFLEAVAGLRTAMGLPD